MTSAARRQRHYRDRSRKGVKVAPVEVTEEVIDALVRRGWLPADQAANMRQVGEAASAVLDSWEVGNLTIGPIAVSTATAE